MRDPFSGHLTELSTNLHRHLGLHQLLGDQRDSVTNKVAVPAITFATTSAWVILRSSAIVVLL